MDKMNNEELKKWAEDLQRREKYLQEKEKELERKFQKQTINDIPQPMGMCILSSINTYASMRSDNYACLYCIHC